MGAIFGALGSLFSFALAITKWLTFKRSRARRAMEAEVSQLDRDAIVERLRGKRKHSGD